MSTKGTERMASHEIRGEDKDDDVIDLLELWRIIWAKRWSIIALTVSLIMLAVLIAYSMTPIYRASSTLLIENKAARVLSIEQIYGVEGTGNEYLQTQFELLKSRSLATRVVNTLRLDQYPEFSDAGNEADSGTWSEKLDVRKLMARLVPSMGNEGKVLSEEEVIERVTTAFIGRITVRQVGRSHLVTVHVDMADPVMAAKAANALADGFIQEQLDARMAMTLTATNWMNDRLSELRDNLVLAESRLQEFRDSEGIVDVGGIVTVSAGELSATRDRMVDARRRRAEAESEFHQVRSVRAQGLDALTSIPAVLANPLIKDFKAKEATAISRVNELSTRYGPRHPTMEAAVNDLASIRESLRLHVDQVVAGIERNYQLAVASEESLRRSVEQNIEEIQEISRKEFSLRELQRDVNTNRALYDTFMTRLKETAATSDMDTVNARVVDRASVPQRPIKPRKQLIVLVAGLLGLMAAMMLAILQNMLNNTFRRTDEIENKLNLPVMGVVPKARETERRLIARKFAEDKDHRYAEAIRTIRTGLVLSSLDRPHKRILVTSSVPGEGKTSLAANLAYALGKNEKVLLLEADLRRPTIAKSFGFSPGEAGLANVLAGNSPLPKAIKTLDGIDVLTAGVVPPNPLEMLSTNSFETLVASLDEIYDRVIIDSAPVQTVSDALILSRYADAVVYVIKSESTTQPVVRSGINRLLQSGAPLVGVVLNHVDVDKAIRNGIDYGGYYDYYAYSSQAKAQAKA